MVTKQFEYLICLSFQPSWSDYLNSQVHSPRSTPPAPSGAPAFTSSDLPLRARGADGKPQQKALTPEEVRKLKGDVMEAITDAKIDKKRTRAAEKESNPGKATKATKDKKDGKDLKPKEEKPKIPKGAAARAAAQLVLAGLTTPAPGSHEITDEQEKPKRRGKGKGKGKAKAASKKPAAKKAKAKGKARTKARNAFQTLVLCLVLVPMVLCVGNKIFYSQ